MSGRCSLGGHDVYYDSKDKCWRYSDNDEEFDKENERPCKRCGNKSTDEDHDYCISNLGYVINACCGHGVGKGYIQFNDGTIIRGYFEIERVK